MHNPLAAGAHPSGGTLEATVLGVLKWVASPILQQYSGVDTSYNTEYSIFHNDNRGQNISILGRWKVGSRR